MSSRGPAKSDLATEPSQSRKFSWYFKTPYGRKRLRGWILVAVASVIILLGIYFLHLASLAQDRIEAHKHRIENLVGQGMLQGLDGVELDKYLGQHIDIERIRERFTELKELHEQMIVVGVVFFGAAVMLGLFAGFDFAWRP